MVKADERSGTSQEALTMSESGIGCRGTGGEDEGRKLMEEVIVTKKGSFGFIRVTVPMYVKETMLTWLKKSGMGRAEFFRVALMMGVNQLAESINAKTKEEGFSTSFDG